MATMIGEHGRGPYNHAGRINDLVIHLNNGKRLLLLHKQAAIPQLDGQIYQIAGSILRFLPNQRRRQHKASKPVPHKQPQKSEGGHYNPADSGHYPLLYIYNGKTSIYNQHTDSTQPLDGKTLSKSIRFSFKNLNKRPANMWKQRCDAYASVHIPKSLPIHRMALTSTGRKIEHNKVVVLTQTSESISSISLEKSGFSRLRCVAVLV